MQMRRQVLVVVLVALAALLVLVPMPCDGWQSVAQSSTTLPTARRGHSMSLWSDSNLVVFGGRSSTSTTPTPSRSNVTVSGCSSFGGCNEFDGWGTCGCSTDASFNTTTCSCTCAYQHSGANCQIYTTDVWFDDVWVFNYSAKSWSQFVGDGVDVTNAVSWPNNRYQHVSVIIGNTMYIHGGYSQLCQDYCSDFWQYAINKYDSAGKLVRGDWTAIDVSPNPGKRWLHTATVWNNTIFIFGGHRYGEYLNDMWAFDPVAGAWSLIEPPDGVVPAARASMASCIDDTSVWYLYGGWNTTFPDRQIVDASLLSWNNVTQYFLRDFWAFNMTAGTWRQITQPIDAVEFPPQVIGARAGFSDGVVFIFHGYQNNDYSSVIWRYNSSTGYWTQHKFHYTVTQIPPARADSAVAYLASRGVFVVFGGWGSDSSGQQTLAESYMNDMWQFNLTLCPDQCNDRGYCFFGYCFCRNSFYGEDCQNRYCPSTQCSYALASQRQTCTHCGGNGQCSMGTCECSEGFITSSATAVNANNVSIECNAKFCVRGCSGKGDCVTTTSGSNICSCNADWYGRDCGLYQCPSDCGGLFGACNYVNGGCTCAETPLVSYKVPPDTSTNGIACTLVTSK